MSDKVYLGNGKKQSATWLKSSICLSDIPQEHTFEYNGKKYVKVNININDTPNQWGKDVSISLDTWQPEETSVPTVAETGETDLPF